MEPRLHVQICRATGWLYVASPSEFRRHLDVDGRRSNADVTNTTTAVPTLELTVGVRDGGSPPRSTLGRLLVVATGVPDGEPVVVSSTSSLLGLSWIQRLVIIVGSALAAALLGAIVFTVVVRSHRSLLNILDSLLANQIN